MDQAGNRHITHEPSAYSLGVAAIDALKGAIAAEARGDAQIAHAYRVRADGLRQGLASIPGVDADDRLAHATMLSRAVAELVVVLGGEIVEKGQERRAFELIELARRNEEYLAGDGSDGGDALDLGHAHGIAGLEERPQHLC